VRYRAVVSKPSLSITGQMAMLKSRGLSMDPSEEAEMGRLLLSSGYYRLSGYWRYFQDGPATPTPTFRPGTTVAQIAAIYRFDGELRSLLSDGLADFEIAFRTRMAYYMADRGLAYLYEDPSTYRAGTQAADLLDTIVREIDRSKEVFLVHHRDNGMDIPIWAGLEATSLGTISKMFRLLDDEQLRTLVRTSFGLPSNTLAGNVFRALAVLRNVCAHHSRLWNRSLDLAMPIPHRLRSKIGGAQPHSVRSASVVLGDLVDGVRNDSSFSDDVRNLLNLCPEGSQGIVSPHRT
jgi:abortive infection bacteriophage resistance protein